MALLKKIVNIFQCGPKRPAGTAIPRAKQDYIKKAPENNNSNKHAVF